MTTTIQNRLVTPELEKALKDYPLYSQDGKKKDAKCIAVFRLANIAWYILEGNYEGNDFIFYGITTGLMETEYGYISANEMASITVNGSQMGLGQLQVLQDSAFKPCLLSSINDSKLQSFLSQMYDRK